MLDRLTRRRLQVAALLAGVIAAPACAQPAPPTTPPLESRRLENVVAFARLFGVVRHFHPTEGVRTANWDDLAIRGVRAVEGAPTADSLARTLTALFATVAPTVRVGTSPVAVPPPVLDDTGSAAGLIAWAHVGIVTEAPDPARPNIYSSALTIVPAPGGTVPDGRPDPAAPWTGELSAGVHAMVPLARFVQLPAAGSAAPSEESPRRRHVRPAPATAAASVADRATRLAGVIVAWNVLQHAYPYFDVVSTDWAAELPRALAAAARDTTPAMYEATLNRLVAALHDGHGNVIAPHRPGVYTAYLPITLDWIEGQLVVTNAAWDAPAGVNQGDVVVAVRGEPIAEVVRKLEPLISSATPQWRRARVAQVLVTGNADSTIAFRVLGADGAEHDVALSFSRRTPTQDALPAPIADLQPGIVYVDLGRATDSAFTAALPRLQGARGIVFDMRGYPQMNTALVLAHLSDSVLHSAHMEVPIILAPDQRIIRSRDEGWRVPPRAPRLTAPVVFLTGGAAISYAESTMGVVEEQRLAPIVGGTTAGTNGNVNLFTVPGGYRVVYTGMRVRKRDGTPHHGVGIAPTVPVERTLQRVREGRDEVLEAGVRVLGGGR